MPRFHFNVRDGSDHPDLEGCELPDIEEARMHAARYAGDLLAGDPKTFWDGTDWRMEVTDEKGLILFSLMFVAIDAP